MQDDPRDHDHPTSGAAPAVVTRDREAPAPTPVAERALAPDLARGTMLLLIVLAHTPWFLMGAELGPTLMHPADGSILDRVAQALTIVVVDTRTHTMFGFLFAYGIGQMWARQLARGTSERDARRLLRRRHSWLLAFGLVHALVLWQGDILGIYGLIGLIMVPLSLQRRDRSLAIWIGILLGIVALVAIASTALGLAADGSDSTGMALQQAAIAETDPLAAAALRLGLWASALLSGLVSLALPAAFLLGILAARHRVLDEPGRHLPLLRRVAIVGIGVGWGVGIVQTLAHVGALGLANPAAFGTLHFATGIGAGVGYAALFGLVGHRLSRRGADQPLPARMLLALGRRSMSGYLAQSVLLVPILAGWTIGLGAHLSSATAFAYGVGVWLVTLVAAFALDRAGRRGPAEVLLRRLTYGGRPRR